MPSATPLAGNLSLADRFTLPGHAAPPEDLAPVSYEDWLDTVTASYRELAPQYHTFHALGMCLGSLLALCERVQHRKGKLVTLAPPVFIDGYPPARRVRGA